MAVSSAELLGLRTRLIAAEARAEVAEAALARAVAQACSTDALIAHLKLQIEKLRRELFGQRSERKARLLDELELELEEPEATATEDELAAEQAASKTANVKGFTRRKPSRKPFPAHLPRERVVIPAPEVCEASGSDRLSKLGETVTETLESIPRQWKSLPPRRRGRADGA